MYRILFIVFCLAVYLTGNAQQNNTTVDISRVEEQLRFSILRDTISIGSELKISYGDLKSNIEDFLDNSIGNYPAVHISTGENYYYNSYALTLLNESKEQLRRNGYELLNEKDFYAVSYKINNTVFNGYKTPTKNIVTNSQLGSIFANQEFKVNTSELYFRLPVFNSETCIDSKKVYSSDVIYANSDKHTFENYSLGQNCLDGYPILVKETIEHFISQDGIHYFDIMPLSSKKKYSEELLNLLLSNSGLKNSISQKFNISGKFDNSGEFSMVIQGLENDFRLKKVIESHSRSNLVTPLYEAKYIESSFELPISFSYKKDSSEKMSYLQLLNNLSSRQDISFNSFNVYKNKFPSLTKQEIAKFKVFQVGFAYDGILIVKNVFYFDHFILPSYFSATKCLLGSGKNELRDFKYTTWIVPISLGLSVLSKVISKISYNNYLNSLPNQNEIGLYNTANTLNKINIISTGVYILSSSIQLTYTIQDLHSRRKQIKDYNNKFPNGFSIY